jgi:hypothetical protein
MDRHASITRHDAFDLRHATGNMPRAHREVIQNHACILDFTRSWCKLSIVACFERAAKKLN